MFKGPKHRWRAAIGWLEKRGVWRGECLPTVGKLLEIRASSFVSCAVGLVSLASCLGLMMLWYCCSSGCSAELWWRCTHVECVHRTCIVELVVGCMYPGVGRCRASKRVEICAVRFLCRSWCSCVYTPYAYYTPCLQAKQEVKLRHHSVEARLSAAELVALL